MLEVLEFVQRAPRCEFHELAVNPTRRNGRQEDMKSALAGLHEEPFSPRTFRFAFNLLTAEAHQL